MKNRKLVEGTTSVETITIDYATEDMPYLKAGTKIIKGMVLDAGAEALFHPIFNNSSTTGGFRKVVFDPENKQIGYLQDNGLWIVKDLPGGLGMVSLGDMRVINGEVSGDGKVLTFDANNMRIGESSNARPGMNQTDFVYTYATFRRISSPMLDFQFDSQLLYRGYGETTFGQFGAPYTTQRGDEIKFIDVHQIGWSYSKDITKSTDQVTLNYKKAEKPEHKEPVGVEERQPIRMAPAQNLSFEMYQEVRIPYALSKNAKVSIYSVDGAKQNVHVNINEGEGFMLYPGALTPGNYGYGVQDGARSGNGMFNIR